MQPLEMADALLSDLCSICNTTKSKYRCPGCAARTCSLPCYKRHQQWAQCTGKRDPTKFVKKSQLATPAGIDHDFNFLTGVERELERAEKAVEDKGLGTPPDVRQEARGRQPTDERYAAARVNVIRAPKGLSRQKENKTHRNKKGNIIWTVEWIRGDKTRTLTESTSAAPLLQIQPFRPSEKPTKKRKRNLEEPPSTTDAAGHDALYPHQAQDEESRDKEEVEERKPSSSGLQVYERDNTAASTDHHGDDSKVADLHDTSSLIHGAESESVSVKYSFFLLRPRTSSKRHVLIPLEPSATLAECLRGRTVLEFPTIYVFPTSTLPPSEEFMLEQDYIRQEGEEQSELKTLMNSVSSETVRSLRDNGSDDKAGEAIGSNKILDVLNQDIGAGV